MYAWKRQPTQQNRATVLIIAPKLQDVLQRKQSLQTSSY